MGHNLIKAERYLEDIDVDNIVISDINIAFELYNIIRLLDSGVRLESWSDERYIGLCSKCKTLKGAVGRYFNTVDWDAFLLQYNDLDFRYRDDFVDALEKYSVYKRVSEEAFSCFLANTAANLRLVIIHKKIVTAFDSWLTSRKMQYYRGCYQKTSSV